MFKGYSNCIEGVERGAIYIEGCSERENTEVMFKLFGFSRVRLGGSPAYKNEQYSSKFEDFVYGPIDFSKISYANINEVAEDDEVKKLLLKGLEAYNSTKTTSSPQLTLKEKFNLAKDDIVNAKTNSERSKAVSRKNALVDELLATYPAEFKQIIAAGITAGCKEVETCNPNLSKYQLDHIKGIISSAFNDEMFIKNLTWHIGLVGIENLESSADDTLRTMGVALEAKINEYINSIKTSNANDNVVADLVPVDQAGEEIIVEAETVNTQVGETPVVESEVLLREQVIDNVEISENASAGFSAMPPRPGAPSGNTSNPTFDIPQSANIDYDWLRGIVNWDSFSNPGDPNYERAVKEKVAFGLHGSEIANAINKVGYLVFNLGQVNNLNDFYIYAHVTNEKNLTLHFTEAHITQVD